MFGLLTTLLLTVTQPTITVKVDGSGFLRFAQSGTPAYAKSATLVDAAGKLCAKSGAYVLPQIRIPAGTRSLSIDLMGNVSADGRPCGRLVIALFQRRPIGAIVSGLLETSVEPMLKNPGDGLAGVIRTDGGGDRATSSGSVAALSRATAAATTGTATIDIRPMTELDSDNILIGEIADVQGDPNLVSQIQGVSLGEAPIFGYTRGISALYVIAKLRYSGISTRSIKVDCPEGAIVKRKCQIIQPDDIIQAATKAAQQQIGSPIAMTPVGNVPAVIAPPGKYSIETGQPYRSYQSISVSISIQMDGAEVANRIVQLRPTNGDMGVQPYQVVKIRIVKDGATVEVPGKCQSGGWIGEQVTVVTDTGATFVGKVVNGSVVEVKL